MSCYLLPDSSVKHAFYHFHCSPAVSSFCRVHTNGFPVPLNASSSAWFWCWCSLHSAHSYHWLCVRRKNTATAVPGGFLGGILVLLADQGPKLYTRCRKKSGKLMTLETQRRLCTLFHNFAKCWPVFKFLPPCDSAVNVGFPTTP